MNSAQSSEPRQELLVPPESYVKNYKHALKEERVALKGGGVFDKALSAVFGWNSMPAYRYNEAMRGVEREKKRSEQYSAENLDLLKAQAASEARAAGEEIKPL